MEASLLCFPSGFFFFFFFFFVCVCVCVCVCEFLLLFIINSVVVLIWVLRLVQVRKVKKVHPKSLD